MLFISVVKVFFSRIKEYDLLKKILLRNTAKLIHRKSLEITISFIQYEIIYEKVIFNE